MAKGTINKLMADHGFGFIKTEEEKHLFFHCNDLQGLTFESLTEGQEVEFEAERTAKGPNVKNVRPAGESS